MPQARGCNNCRSSKVKCDGQRPTCQRCTRLRLTCEGYRSADTLVLMDESHKAAIDSERSRAPRSLPQSQPRRIPGPDLSTKISYIQPLHLKDINRLDSLPWLKDSLPISLPQPKTDVAIARYFANYVLNPNRYIGDDGYLSDLPHLFMKSATNSSLAYAVQACALLSLGLANGDSSIIPDSREMYSKALLSLSSDIAINSLAAKDETLMTILVVRFYELQANDTPVLPENHVRGILPILQIRGQDQVKSSIGWNLFRISHRRVQFQKILKRQSPAAESYQWMSLLDPNHMEVRIGNAVLENLRISAEANNIMETDLDEINRVNRLLSILVAMLSHDATCQSIHKTPSNNYWTPKIVNGMTTYADQWVCTTWNYFTASHLLLYETITKIAASLEPLLQKMGPSNIYPDISHIQARSYFMIQECLKSVAYLTSGDDLDRKGTLNQPQREIGVYFALMILEWISICELTTAEEKLEAERARSDLISTMNRSSRAVTRSNR